tara:strand:+ start:632 stop:1369 length:738 start_codon:yes stop_codon:yes gene_type:complete
MIILIGKRSRLTQALCQKLQDCKVVSTHGALNDKKFAGANKIIISAAITNPWLAVDEINRINVDLPLSIFENNPTAEIITFGTVLEKYEDVTNAYVDSKRMLSEYMLHETHNWKHYRLNTLYGIGEPKKHMFLSDLLCSIRSKSMFEMSTGQQTREYHHYCDVAAILKSELVTKKYGVLEISNGNPISLFNLAQGVIDHLGCPISIVRNQKAKDTVSKSNNKVYNSDKFREPIAGVADYFKGLLS